MFYLQVITNSMNCFAEHFDHLDDVRHDQGKLHQLADILTITLCAVLAGAEGWDDIATFAQVKADWLRARLDLKHGPPSSDTIRRVVATIKAEAFAKGFVRWVESVARKVDGEVIAIDGKTLRRSYDKDDPKAALHIVSAWACQQHLILAQEKVKTKSNEITAIPALLEVLDVAGCIITIDAMGTQVEIAGQIIDQEADYVLALKANQGNLHAQVKEYFVDGAKEAYRKMPVSYAETTDIGHGRKEIRRAWVSSDVEWLAASSRWSGLKSIVLIEHERYTNEKVSVEQRYYISSLDAQADKLLRIVRSHWGIENKVHWVLDVVFQEDQSRIRREDGGQNMAVLRHLALNLLRQDQTKRLSLRMKRKRAGWDEGFLAQLIGF